MPVVVAGPRRTAVRRVHGICLHAVEHAAAKELIAQIRDMQADAPLYDAKVSVLGEYIGHHVGEEEKDLFPKCRVAAMDLNDLGIRLAARKEELMGEMTEGLEVVG